MTDAELNALLDHEWRARLTAAWLIATDRRVRFRERLREMLLSSELVYAGQGYCIAFARFGAAEDADGRPSSRASRGSDRRCVRSIR